MRKPVKGYEGSYEVDHEGRVFSLQRVVLQSDGKKRRVKGMELIPNKNKAGYYTFNLCKNNVHTSFLAHRLVAFAFLNESYTDDKPDINHIDGNKMNNNVSNLEWVSRGENLTKAYEIGLFEISKKEKKFIRSPKKINFEIAEEIRFMSAVTGLRQKDLAEIYKVSQPLIGKILRYEIWLMNDVELNEKAIKFNKAEKPNECKSKFFEHYKKLKKERSKKAN